MVESLLDPLGVGSSDALVDGACMAQVTGCPGGVAALEVAVADAFQGARFVEGHAGVAGNSQCVGMATGHVDRGHHAE